MATVEIVRCNDCANGELLVKSGDTTTIVCQVTKVLMWGEEEREKCPHDHYEPKTGADIVTVEQPVDARDAAEMLQQNTDETLALFGLESIGREEVKALSVQPDACPEPGSQPKAKKPYHGHKSTSEVLTERIVDQVKAGVDNYRDLADVLKVDKFSLKPAVRQLVNDGRLAWRAGAFGRLEIPAEKPKAEKIECAVNRRFNCDYRKYDVDKHMDFCIKPSGATCPRVEHDKKYGIESEKPADQQDEPCPDLGGPTCPCEDVRGCDDAAPIAAEAELRDLEWQKLHVGPCRTCHYTQSYPADKDGHVRLKCVGPKATAKGRIIRQVDQVRTEGCYSPQIGVEPSKEPEPAPEKPKKQKRKDPCIICGKPVLMSSDNPDKHGGGFLGPGCLSSENYVHDTCDNAFPGLSWKIARGEAKPPSADEIARAIEEKARMDKEARLAQKNKARGKVVGMCDCGQGVERKMNELGEVWCDDCGLIYKPDPNQDPVHPNGKWILCTPEVSLSCVEYHPEKQFPPSPCEAYGGCWSMDQLWGSYCGYYKSRQPSASKTSTSESTSECTSEQTAELVPESKRIRKPAKGHYGIEVCSFEVLPTKADAVKESKKAKPASGVKPVSPVAKHDQPVNREKPHKAVKYGECCQSVVKLPTGQRTLSGYSSEA